MDSFCLRKDQDRSEILGVSHIYIYNFFFALRIDNFFIYIFLFPGLSCGMQNLLVVHRNSLVEACGI